MDKAAGGLGTRQAGENSGKEEGGMREVHVMGAEEEEPGVGPDASLPQSYSSPLANHSEGLWRRCNTARMNPTWLSGFTQTT